jgi:cysteine-rich repeat protein
MTFNLYIKRSIWYWANFLKIGNGERRSPAFWTYEDYGTSTNRWVTGGGSRLHMRLETTSSWNDGLDPDMKLAHGRWYSVAFLVDRYHAAVYINGAVQLVYPIYGEVVPAVGNQLLNMGQSVWAPSMDIDDFRYYKGSRLSTAEIEDIFGDRQLDACGDGVRSRGEACDDGNLIDQDGCSRMCVVEPGFVCFGQNTTVVAADRCWLGTYEHALSFETPVSDPSCFNFVDDSTATLRNGATYSNAVSGYTANGYASLGSSASISFPLVGCRKAVDIVTRYSYVGNDLVCRAVLEYRDANNALIATFATEFKSTSSSDLWELTPVQSFSQISQDGVMTWTIGSCQSKVFIDRIEIRPRGQTITNTGNSIVMPFPYISSMNEGATFAIGPNYAHTGTNGLLLRTRGLQNTVKNQYAWFDLPLDPSKVSRGTHVEFDFKLAVMPEYYKAFALTISVVCLMIHSFSPSVSFIENLQEVGSSLFTFLCLSRLLSCCLCH